MTTTSGTRIRCAAAAITVAATLMAAGATSALAQDYPSSVVTIGGSGKGVDGGHGVVIAPGVIIDGGDVFNETGIGVVSSGGSSIGATAGGDTNAATVE